MTFVPVVRSFIAVNLSVATLRSVADAQQRLRQAIGGALKVAWVPSSNMHVTLKFLGNVDASLPEVITDTLAKRLRERPPFEVEAVGMGAFPDSRRPRVLWVGLREPQGALTALWNDIETWMEELGLEREPRPFSPHLTLGRVKEGHHSVADILAQFQDTVFGTSRIAEVVVYESRLNPKGAEYRALGRAPLGGSVAKAALSPSLDVGGSPRSDVGLSPQPDVGASPQPDAGTNPQSEEKGEETTPPSTEQEP